MTVEIGLCISVVALIISLCSAYYARRATTVAVQGSDQDRNNQDEADESSSAEESDEDYARFFEVWKHYAEDKTRSHEQLDAWLLKLSAGALALSLAPATKLFEAGGARGVLVLAWMLFGVAIGATVRSMLASARSAELMADRAFKTMVQRQQLKDDDQGTRGVKRANNVALGSFLMGLAFGLIYVATILLAQG